MVSPWLENGHLQRYLAQHPEVPCYPLVSGNVLIPVLIPALKDFQCIQLAIGVAYLHSVDMASVATHGFA